MIKCIRLGLTCPKGTVRSPLGRPLRGPPDGPKPPARPPGGGGGRGGGVGVLKSPINGKKSEIQYSLKVLCKNLKKYPFSMLF